MKNLRKVVLMTGTVLASLSIGDMDNARAVDAETRKPLYVVKIDSEHAEHPTFGLSPWNDYTFTDYTVNPNVVRHIWGHAVQFELQIRDNNNLPYGKGNPIERYHDYSENSNFKDWRDSNGATLGPRYAENAIGSTWSPENEGIGVGDSTFTDTNGIWHFTRPRTDDDQYYSVTTTHWFEFDQRWHVKVRTGEEAHPNVEGKTYRTDSLHHLTATQANRTRENG